MVAMPFSTVSGVLFGSCDPSLGAIFVARVLNTNHLKLTMKWSVFESLLDESVLKGGDGTFCDAFGVLCTWPYTRFRAEFGYGKMWKRGKICPLLE